MDIGSKRIYGAQARSPPALMAAVIFPALKFMHLLQENTLRGSKTWRSKKCNLAHQTQTRLIAAPKHTCIAQQLQMQKEKFWEILAAHKVSRRQSCTEKEFRNAAKVGSKDLQCVWKSKDKEHCAEKCPKMEDRFKHGRTRMIFQF